MGARAGARGKNLFPVESAALAAALQRGEAAGSQPAGEGGRRTGRGPSQRAGRASRQLHVLPRRGRRQGRRAPGGRTVGGGRKGEGPGPAGNRERGVGPGPAEAPRRRAASRRDASRPAPAHRVLLLHHLVHLLGDADDLVLRGHGCGCPSGARRGATGAGALGADPLPFTRPPRGTRPGPPPSSAGRSAARPRRSAPTQQPERRRQAARVERRPQEPGSAATGREHRRGGGAAGRGRQRHAVGTGTGALRG